MVILSKQGSFVASMQSCRVPLNRSYVRELVLVNENFHYKEVGMMLNEVQLTTLCWR